MSLALWEFFLDPAAWSGVGVTADLSVTEENDSLAAAGALQVVASLAKTEAGDTLTAAAAVTVAASLSVTEAADTLGSGATVAIAGSLAVTEANDGLAAAGALAIAAVLSVTDEADALTATGTTGGSVTADLGITEANDGLIADGSIVVAPQAFGGRGGRFSGWRPVKPRDRTEQDELEELAALFKNAPPLRLVPALAIERPVYSGPLAAMFYESPSDLRRELRAVRNTTSRAQADADRIRRQQLEEDEILLLLVA